MFRFGRKPIGHAYGALIDIASGSVGVAIVESHPEKKLPTLIYTHRITMRITKHGARKDENLRRVREALFSASLVLSQEGYQALKAHDPNAIITKLYVTCSSPWSFTVARNVHYENDESFKVTHAIVNDLVHSAEEEIISQLKGHARLESDGFDIVERATVDITVNEYPVADPFHLKGTTLGLSHVAGLIPEEIMTSVHEVQDKLFPDTELRAHTYMLVMYCVLRDLFPRVHSLCIIDITGEATEFGIVENNLLIENTYIPRGSNTFVRDVMSATGKPAGDIYTSMRLMNDDPEASVQDLKPQIAQYEDEVIKGLAEVIARRTLPPQVVITSHRAHEKFFKRIIESALKKAIGKDPSVIAVEPKIIDEISHGAGDDVYLALSARFFHKLHGCGETPEN